MNQEVFNVLYAQKDVPCENRVNINDVMFHKHLLSNLQFFNDLLKYQTDNVKLDITETCLNLFRKWLYKQSIHFTEFKTDDEVEGISVYAPNNSVLDISLIKEIKCISQKWCISLFADLKDEIIKYINSSTLDIKQEYINTFELNEKMRFTEEEFKMLDKRSNLYALCLYYGINCDKDVKKAYELFKLNWEEKKCKYGLHNYAVCLRDGYGCKKNEKEAFKLLKLNWEENKNVDSLYVYALCLRLGNGCERDDKEALKLFKLNWDDNKHSKSLYQYAYCLYHGYGQKADKRQAYEIHKLNWEVNRNIDSLWIYADCLNIGIGCNQDKRKAAELMEIFNRYTAK